MESEQCLPHFVVFQGKPEYETIAEKFESFHSNHFLKPRRKKCNKSNKIGPMHKRKWAIKTVNQRILNTYDYSVQNPPNRIPSYFTLYTPST